ncbi:MAG: family 43 glycosylhydrolase [Sedimentisphaerales bacterium]|nr:family 43 glycosylhydrolase [Sedimentisphaerales bacterium]
MNRYNYYSLILGTLFLFVTNLALAQNPLIMEQFSADPTARVFEGKIYVYPSHDIPTPPGRGGRSNWFCMEDYHVYSSENLTDWKDHGVILSQAQVPWLGRQSYDMWAPDCVEKNGKYYFYYPTGGRIGVAVADKPYGPFKPEAQPINGVRGIDPGIIIDDDGSAYLFYSDLMCVKLKDNMLEIDSQPRQIANLPRKGLREGPFPFKRNGIYYLSYPHVQNNTERLEYATASSPMGPYEWKGVIMDESASGCWTNHHSVVEYKGQWYLFYHDKDLSPNFDKNRSIKADYLYFNEDGTIQKVIPTHRGVGISSALKEIQIDRYSEISQEGASIAFVDPNQTKNGWKTILAAQDAWIRYNKVDFGQNKLKSVSVKALSETGSTIEIRIDSIDGQLLAKVDIAKNSNLSEVKAAVSGSASGVHDLVVIHKDAKPVEIDWVKFE